jgi:anaerobic magnesium-protoporphyrin IX monomethyl ester cyclase
MFLMWGYDGEELEDIEATIEHVKRSDPDIFFTTIAYPIKGTPYYQRVADSLVELKPWAVTSDREITLRGRRPARFYEFADRLLRDEVQLARLQRGNTQDSSEQELRARIQCAREGLYASIQRVEA